MFTSLIKRSQQLKWGFLFTCKPELTYRALSSNLPIFSGESSLMASFLMNQGEISALTSSGIFDRRRVFLFIITHVLRLVSMKTHQRNFKNNEMYPIRMQGLITLLLERKQCQWCGFWFPNLVAFHFFLTLQPMCRFPVSLPYIRTRNHYLKFRTFSTIFYEIPYCVFEKTYQIGYWSSWTCILETTQMRLFFIIPWVAPNPSPRSPDIHTWFSAVSCVFCLIVYYM